MNVSKSSSMRSKDRVTAASRSVILSKGQNGITELTYYQAFNSKGLRNSLSALNSPGSFQEQVNLFKF